MGLLADDNKVPLYDNLIPLERSAWFVVYFPVRRGFHTTCQAVYMLTVSILLTLNHLLNDVDTKGGECVI